MISSASDSPVDPTDDKCAGSVDPSSSSCSGESAGSEDGVSKSCTFCQTTNTPLWRCGPQGPKTLCNACGIKYSKKSRDELGIPSELKKEKKKSSTAGVAIKIQMIEQNNQVVLKQQKHHYYSELHGCSWIHKQRRGKRRSKEVEQAAVLLMALSSGLFYAR